jgi:hypothetical protein
MTIWQILIGGVFAALSLADAWKYVWESRAIRRAGTSAGHSRRFISVALLSDTSRLAYGLAVSDWFVVISGVTALITMGQMWWTVYTLYPYSKKRYRKHRPNPWAFLIAGLKREKL